jgi:hypothetical protein
MPEVADASEYHGQSGFVGSGNHFIVTDGTTWLHDGGDSSLGGQLNVVGEGEERV